MSPAFPSLVAESLDVVERKALVLYRGALAWHPRVLPVSLGGGQSDDFSVLTFRGCGRRVESPQDCQTFFAFLKTRGRPKTTRVIVVAAVLQLSLWSLGSPESMTWVDHPVQDVPSSWCGSAPSEARPVLSNGRAPEVANMLQTQRKDTSWSVFVSLRSTGECDGAFLSASSWSGPVGSPSSPASPGSECRSNAQACSDCARPYEDNADRLRLWRSSTACLASALRSAATGDATTIRY